MKFGSVWNRAWGQLFTVKKCKKDELCKNSPAGRKQHNETIVNTRSTKCNCLHLFIVITVAIIVIIVDDELFDVSL